MAAGNGWLANTVVYPAETSLTLAHFIFEGTFDKFPGLKVIGAHGGGYMPSYADRADHSCLVSPVNCNPDIKLKKQPTRGRCLARRAAGARGHSRDDDKGEQRRSDSVQGVPRVCDPQTLASSTVLVNVV